MWLVVIIVSPEKKRGSITNQHKKPFNYDLMGFLGLWAWWIFGVVNILIKVIRKKQAFIALF